MPGERPRYSALPACGGPIDGDDDRSAGAFAGLRMVVQAARFDSAKCLWQGARRMLPEAIAQPAQHP